MSTASLAQMELPLLGLFARPSGELLARRTLHPNITYVFGRRPDLGETRHRLLAGQELEFINLDGGGDNPHVGRLQGALKASHSGVTAVDLHPAPRLRLQKWGAPKAQVLTAPTALPALSCIWTPNPGAPGISNYQLAVVNPAVMRFTDNLRLMALKARELITAAHDDRDQADVATVTAGGDPTPAAGQLCAIVQRYAEQVSFPSPTDSFEATSRGPEDRARDQALERLRLRVSGYAGWKMGRGDAIGYLADAGFLHPVLLERAAAELGIDLGFGWIGDEPGAAQAVA